MQAFQVKVKTQGRKDSYAAIAESAHGAMMEALNKLGDEVGAVSVTPIQPNALG